MYVQLYTQHVISMCLKNLACTADMGTRNDMMNDMKNGKVAPNLSALN